MELNGQNTQSDPNNGLIWEAQSSSYDSDLMSPHADPYVYHTQAHQQTLEFDLDDGYCYPDPTSMADLDFSPHAQYPLVTQQSSNSENNYDFSFRDILINNYNIDVPEYKSNRNFETYLNRAREAIIKFPLQREFQETTTKGIQFTFSKETKNFAFEHVARIEDLDDLQYEELTAFIRRNPSSHAIKIYIPKESHPPVIAIFCLYVALWATMNKTYTTATFRDQREDPPRTYGQDYLLLVSPVANHLYFISIGNARKEESGLIFYQYCIAVEYCFKPKANHKRSKPKEHWVLRESDNGSELYTRHPLYVDGPAMAQVWLTVSDMREKEDIEPIVDPHKIDSVQLYSYRYKTGAQVRRRGYMAQDVERVEPSLVYQTSNGIKAVDYDGVNLLKLHSHELRIKALEKHWNDLVMRLERDTKERNALDSDYDKNFVSICDQIKSNLFFTDNENPAKKTLESTFESLISTKSNWISSRQESLLDITSLYLSFVGGFSIDQAKIILDHTHQVENWHNKITEVKAYHCLADVYLDQGDLPRSRQHYERCRSEIENSNQWDEDMSTLKYGVLYGLSIVDKRENRINDAKQKIQDCLLICERLANGVTDDNIQHRINVWATKKSLANVCTDSRNYKEAENWIGQCLVEAKKLVPQKNNNVNHYTLITEVDSTRLCVHQFLYDDTMSDEEKKKKLTNATSTLNCYLSDLGDTHRFSLMLKKNLTCLYQLQGDFNLAIQHLESYIELREGQKQRRTLKTLGSQVALVELFLNGQHLEKAIDQLDCCLELYGHLTAEHLDRLSCSACQLIEKVCDSELPTAAQLWQKLTFTLRKFDFTVYGEIPNFILLLAITQFTRCQYAQGKTTLQRAYDIHPEPVAVDKVLLSICSTLHFYHLC